MTVQTEATGQMTTATRNVFGPAAGAAGQAPTSRGSVLAHRGFTLIEVLVVIVIIGILAGLVAPGVMSAYRRSQEYAIESEITQLSAALEQFKNKYGFYPPDFTRINSVNDFLPYLNRVAPNHAENTTTLSNWWSAVGSKLRLAGPQTSYVFWLSGLAKNKQYPLTDISTGTPTPLAAFNVGTVEREVFFEFKNDRLYDPSSTPPQQSANSNNLVATYSQFSGTCQPFVYIEVKSLAAVNLTLPVASSNFVAVNTSDGVYNLFPYFVVRNGNRTEFLNKDSYQLLAPGMDSEFSDRTRSPRQNTPNLTNDTPSPRERDNLTNFSEGRLEKTLLQ